MRIMLDPGHGGRDSGAAGPGGTRESDVNLAVAKLLADYLRPVAEIKLTRDCDRALGSDESTDLRARVAAAEDWQADYFISIHCNAGSNTAKGVETFALAAGGQGEKLAKAIQSELVKETGLTNRGVKFSNFYVLRKTSMPAVLIELAFISNPTEEKLLKNPAWQDRVAKAIAQGVANFLGIKLPTSNKSSLDMVLILAGSKRIEGKLIDGRTWAPIADVLNALGIKYTWDGLTRTVKII